MRVHGRVGGVRGGETCTATQYTTQNFCDTSLKRTCLSFAITRVMVPVYSGARLHRGICPSCPSL